MPGIFIKAGIAAFIRLARGVHIFHRLSSKADSIAAFDSTFAAIPQSHFYLFILV